MKISALALMPGLSVTSGLLVRVISTGNFLTVELPPQGFRWPVICAIFVTLPSSDRPGL